MTEQIKSAIHCMRANQGIGFCEECPAYAKVGKGHCVRESCRIAENSLKAWEEVLNELEKKNALYMSYLSNKENPYDSELFGKHIAVENCIDIINQHLAEIKEKQNNDNNK